MGDLGSQIGWFWRSWCGLGAVLGTLMTAWGSSSHESSYAHFLDLILSLRPGVLMKGFFITFGFCRGASGGQRRERRERRERRDLRQ